MHRSKLPLTVWFWAAHLMATHSNGMSAVQLEAQLGITYKTAWLLAQKLRQSMIDPQREPLEGAHSPRGPRTARSLLGRPEAVVAELGRDPGRRGAPADHP
jgi:hypothetical protein